MRIPKPIIYFALVITLIVATAGAATFVVPPDRDLVRRTDAIVIGSALVSYSQLNASGGIETVTSISVESVIKGSRLGDTINVVEPGGVFGNRATIISGVPRFTEGQRMLLFLNRTGADHWSATELVLGKFTFATEGPQTLLVRDEDEIVGWDPDLKQHRESRRDAARFLQFVRDEVGGRVPRANYIAEAPSGPAPAPSPRLVAAPNFVAAVNAFSANSYTMTLSGTTGGRWNAFPNGVNWFRGTTQEPGAPGGGATAITTAFASWDNDAGSNVNYVYAGVDNGTHAQGLRGADGANTILFERDLSAWGAGPFACSGSSYGGTLGIGGISSASGQHTGPNGEVFWTTREGDVEMNKGIANCTILFNNGDWNTAVTHEFGHTLGFRHSDQNRASNGACSATGGLECSSSAIMTAVVTHVINGALQPWDINAARAVYPGATNSPPPPPPPGGAYDNDGKADEAVWRPKEGNWYIKRTSGGTVIVQWGLLGDVPIPADFDGDRVTDPAVWRNGVFLARLSTGGSKVVWIGTTGDIPLKGDFDGDRRADFAVWRPSSGTFFIQFATGGTAARQWGYPTDIPVPADYDGDGKSDYAVWRPAQGNWYIINSSTGIAYVRQWGFSSDKPVPADYDGDGRADPAVWRPSEGNWYLNRTSTGVAVIQLGLPGDIPKPEDFDGDGRADPCVWRPTSGYWFRRNGLGQLIADQWGAPNDIPVPSR
jgi:hypothetical protein